MAISLYDLSVASFLQTLGGVEGFLQRGLDHCRDNNMDPSEIVETRLYGDMLPFRFQIVSVAHHSLGAIDALEGGEVVFQIRDFKMPFTAEGFLMSFSLPNFHFHATTAYDILRSKGVPLGKRDYMGQMRMKG
jgi:hypothetical protein